MGYYYHGDFMKTEYKQKYRLLGLNIAYYKKLKGYTQEMYAEKLLFYFCTFLV